MGIAMNDSQIIEALSLGELSGEEKQKTVDSVRMIVEARVGEVLLALMSDKQLGEFDLIKENPHDVEEWQKDNFKDIDEIRARILGDYIDEFKSRAQ